MAFKRFFSRTSTTTAPDRDITNRNHGVEIHKKLLGLRQCTIQESNQHILDVVFVHGLTGDREKTWTHQASSQFWPQDLLPSDLPKSRIFTYGYDADVAHFFSRVSQSRIGDHAQTLLGSLSRIRERTESNRRPLFFVAHSLGGLVVEDMLLASKNSADEHHRRVLDSTEGIVFMGTPHCGSRLADWASVCLSVTNLVNSPSRRLVTVLQPESEVLARIQQEFHNMLRARNNSGKQQIRITCFYEDLVTPGLGLVVPKHSAILSAYSNYAVHADHSGMTKFLDGQDPGYLSVSGELLIWARDVQRRSEVNQRPISDHKPFVVPSEEPQSDTGKEGAHVRGRQYYQGSMHHNGVVIQGSSIANFRTL